MDSSSPGSPVHVDSPGKNTRVGSHSPLLEVFPNRGSNLCLLHCGQILYCLSHQITPVCVCVCVCVSCLVLSNSGDPIASSSSPGPPIHGILQHEYWSRSHSHLQGIFPMQGSNQGILHCRQIRYHCCYCCFTPEPLGKRRELSIAL